MNIVEYLNNNHFTVLWSGGKDSTAALLWVLDHVRHDDWDVLYIEVTGNTHPLCTQYVIETAKQLGILNKLKIVGRKDIDFFNMLKQKGIPLLNYRWCFEKFRLPFIEKIGIAVSGVKKSDSVRRRALKTINYFMLGRTISICPIVMWSTEQVVRYIKEHGIEINPCYRLYGHSGNCMFCPLANKVAIAKTMSDPEWRDKIVDALTEALKRTRSKVPKQIILRWLSYAKNTDLLRFINKSV